MNILKRINAALATVEDTKAITSTTETKVQALSDSIKSMNDGELASLRTTLENSRKMETEMLYALMEILDHVFALHVAASRSQQPGVLAKISEFQNACRICAEHGGLSVIITESGQAFNSRLHHLTDEKQTPLPDSIVSNTIACGYLLRGKLLRPALVTLRKPVAI